MTRTRTRILAAGLSLIVLLAALFVVPPAAGAEEADVWDGTVAAGFAGGKGTKDDPYIISNGAELAYFSKSVGSYYQFYYGQYVSLTADIDLGNKPWTPIGNNGNFFEGVFDGNGHTVSHVNVNLSDTKEVGLFGKTGNRGDAESGTIKNLTVMDSTITGTECENVGAVVGNGQYVVNCRSINNVVTGKENVGGVCGQVNGSISRCYNTSSVTGEEDVGGVFGAALLSSGAGYTVEECYNAGSVTGTGTGKPVGGVGGVVEYRATSDCLNTGVVTAAADNIQAGGVFGWLKELTANRCVSTGNVLGDTKAGAAVGELTNGAAITDFYYDSEVCSLDNGSGTAKTTAELSGALLTGFDDNWIAGGERIRETGGRYGVRETCYISLKNVGEPSVADGTPVYDFSVDDARDWQKYTPISNAIEFLAIGTDSTKWKENFVLTRDLDLSGMEITPIGENIGNAFTGRFSGDRHVISNVQINRDDYAGLFGYVGCDNVMCGTVMLLGVNGDISSSGAAGGICGYGNGASIYGCYFTGTISGYSCGGIVSFNAINSGRGMIKDCYAAAAISAESGKGGITADTSPDISITNCYYSSTLCSDGTGKSGTALTTLEMLSSDALDKMSTTENLWVKKANDKENHIAYYPSFSEDNAAAVSYTTELSFEKHSPEAPVYGDNIVFTVGAELKFGDNDEDISHDTDGDFSIKLGENTVTSSKTTGNKYALSWTADRVDDVTLTLVYSGSSSEFFPEEIAKDLVVSVDRKELTAADIAFEPPASLTFDGSEHPAGLTANVDGAGELTVTYYNSDGEPLDTAPVNAGDYTVTVSAAEGEFCKAASGLTDDDWAFAIAKAAAPKISESMVKFSYAATGEKSVPAAGLPEDMGAVGEISLTFTGDDIGKDVIVADSMRYSDGRVYFTLAEDKAMNRYGYIDVTVPSQNYEDISFRICVVISDKNDIEAPASGEFSLALTNDGSDITARIETELSGVEFSFDGTTWGAENTAPVGHDELVTGYVRYAETEDYNASPAASVSLRSGHGALAHHARVETTCTAAGSVEYWECELCKRYFLDEDGKTETTAEATVIAKTKHTGGDPVKENAVPATCTTDGSYDMVVYCTACNERISTEHVTEPATGHSWSEAFESDKDGHWHKCATCGAASEKEAHISGGAATTASAEVCTACGYVISPKKTSGGSSTGGGSSYRPTTPAPADTNPAINGSQKSWTDIAADLGGQNGGSAVISLNGETTVPAEVIKAIAEKKLKVEFVIDSARSWLMDGAKIAAASAADFTILPGNADRSALRGVLGANMKISGTNIPADLKLSFRKEFAGQFANVYKMTDGRLEFQGCVRLGEDGAAVVSGAYTAGGYVVMVCGFSDLSGDISNDGVLNAFDAAELLKSVVGISEGANPLMGDFNGDGAVNALDASAILRHLVSAA